MSDSFTEYDVRPDSHWVVRATTSHLSDEELSEAGDRFNGLLDEVETLGDHVDVVQVYPLYPELHFEVGAPTRERVEGLCRQVANRMGALVTFGSPERLTRYTLEESSTRRVYQQRNAACAGVAAFGLAFRPYDSSTSVRFCDDFVLKEEDEGQRDLFAELFPVIKKRALADVERIPLVGVEIQVVDALAHPTDSDEWATYNATAELFRTFFEETDFKTSS